MSTTPRRSGARCGPARTISFFHVLVDLPPMTSARDAADAVEAVIAAVGRGELTPQEGASVAGLIETYRRTLELTEIEERVAELERVTARL